MRSSQTTLLNIIKSRRTARKYTGRIPSNRLVESVIRVAAHAPSAHNSQPWFFIHVASRAKRRDLIELMVRAWKEAMKEDRRDPELISQTVTKFEQRFSAAPVLIVCCLDHSRLYYDRYRDDDRRRKEAILGHHSLSAAVQNILLACTVKGLSACWYSAPLFCSDAVRKALGLAENLEPSVLLTVGFPAGSPKKKPMRSFGEIFSRC
ncbi:MAG: nitroreductase family protein [Thermoprotei archaeon]